MDESTGETNQINSAEASEAGDRQPFTPAGINAIQGISESKGEWVDRGMVDVPVKDLPMPEDVSSPADFDHHISWEDASSATQQLPGIQDQVRNGKTGDDFSAEDQAAGLDYGQGKRRVYDLFYGSDPVTLNKDGDQYDIVSGRHRVYAAKELDLPTIPARLFERVSKA